MNPKEKARELYNKFNDATLTYDCGDYSAKGINNSIMAMVMESKNCALICVDEIQRQSENWGVVSVRAYWQQVKTEINNL